MLAQREGEIKDRIRLEEEMSESLLRKGLEKYQETGDASDMEQFTIESRIAQERANILKWAIGLTESLPIRE